ncbi:glycosyltransferase family 2 protein [Novosphingobium sp. BW1]|uniref:glycosyltransferase family 2 protein n=1 Tax=Novosphingobium sp. BW1 TaxID=2592621 RepID=UPI00352C4441
MQVARSCAGRALLRVAVHGDALRRHPLAWVRAAWWRLLGKRLRARAQMAPLLGTSPRAYRLWLSQGAGTVPQIALAQDAPRIKALVVEGEGLTETLDSLARENVQARSVAVQSPPLWTDFAEQDAEGFVWLLPLRAGDVLAPGAGALYRAAAQAALPLTRIVYADDDLRDPRGQRHTPHFKPDWNAELFAHHDYLSGASLLRVEAQDLADLPAQNWIASLVGRALAAQGGAAPQHLRHILHHRRARPEPRRPLDASTRPETPEGGWPQVSVIVPTRNRVDLLRTCLEGLRATDYPGALDVLVIDNGSDDPATLEYLSRLDPAFARVLAYPGPFNFAAMNNRALEEAGGELVCFLNNDIEMRDPHWLAVMARQALRPEVGAVGARLLYPDGRIQHAGVVIGIGGGAAHAHRLLDPDETGYFARHALPQFVSAVTAACLVVRRDKVLAVGGFDAANFAVAFNDVDLCLKLNAQGWQSFYEPRATLVHHESVSRGLDRDPVGAARLAGELAALKARWGTGGAQGQVAALGEAVDPFHHPALSPYSERFAVRL